MSTPTEPVGILTPGNDPVFVSDDPKMQAVLTDLQRTAMKADGALRNLLITQRYHEISEQMKGVVGSENVNWCTFACWASKTAGESIRREELPDFAHELLRAEGVIEKILATVKQWLGLEGDGEVEAFDDVRAILDGVSEKIALGNLQVYAEISPLFARFVGQLGDGSQLDEAAWLTFSRVVRNGSPEQGGQDLLRTAFREYYEARHEKRAALRSQKILLANVLVGLHEQTRLQAAIKGALDVPAEQALDEVLEATVRLRLPNTDSASIAAHVAKVSPLIRTMLIEGWERIATRVAMRLALPDGKSVSLGENVPLVDGRMFPESLSQLDYAPLVNLVEEYDVNPGSTAGSAACDWTELPQRMNFILDLFRANQQNQRLYQPPFNSSQYADFSANRMPADTANL